MKSFEHVDAMSVASAVKLVGSDGGSKLIGGGTDLLAQMKAGIVQPCRLVNLKTIPGLSEITFDEASGLELGALATLGSIMEDRLVKLRYPLLHQSILLTASPQLRNFGTLGGNLGQGIRCWYYRSTINCWLKGGDRCYARDAENSHHAIFGQAACNSVHPSDPAVALMALGAKLTIAGPRGRRILPLSEFFQTPKPDRRQVNVLKPDEIILRINIPAPAPGSRGAFLKAMDRKIWAFALVSVAVLLNFDGNVVKDAGLVLGGVATMPWRLPDVESLLKGKTLDDSLIGQAAEMAVAGAKPLTQNGYKIPLVKGLIIQSLESLKQ